MECAMKIFAVAFAAFLIFAAGTKALADAGDTAVFTIGGTKVTALRDAPGKMPLSIFHGATEADMKQYAPSGETPAGVTVFLLQQGGKNILVDTGYGPGKGALLSVLATAGVKPEDIDTILVTHMHRDHIGGLAEAGKALYPKAKVLVSRVSLSYWTENAAPGLEANAAMVKGAQQAYGDRFVTFDFATDVLPGIHAVATVGHTPGHTAFMLSDGDKKILFWGDLVHGAAIQFPMPEVCARYDMNPAEAADTRKSVMGTAADREIPVAGAHLPFPAVGRVLRDGKAFTFAPGL